MTARATSLSLGSGGGATEQAVDRGEPLVADVDALLVHIERDVGRADLVRHLLRERADVLAARLGMREGVLDRRADRRLGRVGDARLELAAGEDPGQRDRQPGLALP